MPFLPRGVYRAPWLLADCPVLVAIDHDHNIIDWQIVRPQDDACALLEGLWNVLEAQDQAPPKPLGTARHLTAS